MLIRVEELLYFVVLINKHLVQSVMKMLVRAGDYL